MSGGEHEERQTDATSAGLLLDLLYCERESQSTNPSVTLDTDTDTDAERRTKGSEDGPAGREGRAATPELAAAKGKSGRAGAIASTQVRDELADRWNEEAEAEDSEGVEDALGSSSSDLCPLCARRCEEHHRCGSGPSPTAVLSARPPARPPTLANLAR